MPAPPWNARGKIANSRRFRRTARNLTRRLKREEIRNTKIFKIYRHIGIVLVESMMINKNLTKEDITDLDAFTYSYKEIVPILVLFFSALGPEISEAARGFTASIKGVVELQGKIGLKLLFMLILEKVKYLRSVQWNNLNPKQGEKGLLNVAAFILGEIETIASAAIAVS